MRIAHPNSEVEAALRDAEVMGWSVDIMSATDLWAYLSCPERGACRVAIWREAPNPALHAERIRAIVAACPHGRDD